MIRAKGDPDNDVPRGSAFEDVRIHGLPGLWCRKRRFRTLRNNNIDAGN
jgi:hypothetical protein